METKINKILLLLLLFNLCITYVAFCNEYTNNLIAYYPINGNAKNIINNETNGNINNVLFVNNRKGVENSACQFTNQASNSASYIEIPNVSNTFDLNDATISIWLKYTDTSADYAVIIAKPLNNGGDNSGDSFILYNDYKNEQLVYSLSSKDKSVDIKMALPVVNKWHNIVISWGSGILPDFLMILYVDGEFIETKYNGSDFSVEYDNNPLLIGADEYFFDNSKHWGFNGIIDDISIYNKVIINHFPLPHPETSLPYQIYECDGAYQFGFDEGFSFAKTFCKNNPVMCDINVNGIYTEQDVLNMMNNILKWDINKDKQIGLLEAIHILKDVSKANIK